MKILAIRRAARAAMGMLAGAAICTTASAGSYASITVSDFRIGLTDLRPGDGIDPAMAFVLPTSILGNKIDVQAGTLNAQPYMVYGGAVGPQPLDPIAAQAVAPTAAAYGSIGPGSSASNTTVKLSGWAGPSSLVDDRSEFLARATLPASAMIFGNLSLSPRTSISFSFDVDMSVGTTGGVEAAPVYGGEFARAIMGFSIATNNANQGQSTQHWLEVQSSFSNGVYTGKTDSGHWTETITLTNDSDDVMYAQATLSTEIWGFTSANPVPEPGPALLMTSGVLLLAAMRSRRKPAAV
ncbi:hypothetical protein ACS5PN_26090 [Roseateles sp. NT4]|uniref:hypothetical protein n=1 Tax=Roseateles sp. NT4 TaxID=3453715 RepID=UPI003EE9ADE9